MLQAGDGFLGSASVAAAKVNSGLLSRRLNVRKFEGNKGRSWRSGRASPASALTEGERPCCQLSWVDVSRREEMLDELGGDV